MRRTSALSVVLSISYRSTSAAMHAAASASAGRSSISADFIVSISLWRAESNAYSPPVPITIGRRSIHATSTDSSSLTTARIVSLRACASSDSRLYTML